jgi:signal transduction histidine kinase/CheY-like chemotaxis protein
MAHRQTPGDFYRPAAFWNALPGATTVAAALLIRWQSGNEALAKIAGMQAGDPIRIEQTRSIYRNSAPGLLTTYVTVTVLSGALVFIEAAALIKALIFIGAMTVQTGVRLVLYREFARRAPNLFDWKPWADGFTAGAFAGGLTIGIGAIWMMDANRQDTQIIALLVIFAVTGGVVGAMGAYLPAFFAFFFAVSIAPAIWLFSLGDAWHITIGVLFVLWFAAVAEQARRTSRQFADTIRLRLENQDLVESLRREKAAAEEANVAKSRFLASASHDLRQPVHAMSLFVAALRAHEMNPEARGLLDHIETSVRSLSGLFGGLLDISRLDAGVVEVRRTAFSVEPIMERLCKDFQADAARKGLQLRVQPTRAFVDSDPILFERILRNIVANAVAYTGRGSVLVGCRRRSKGLRVQVLDTGIGIEPNEQLLVFQEFYQIGNPERDRTRGVGLGLAIVKRLTTLLDHPLELRSVPGKGTCFSIDVPFATAPAGAPALVSPSSLIPSVQGSGLILVVDDEAAIQVAMKSLLQSWGYSVIAAGSFVEMMDRIASNILLPRLIICDYRLRENETGSTVIERLRNEYNDEIPGMLITGDTAPDRLKEAQASGYLLLHKPVANDRLREAIEELTRTVPKESSSPAPAV